MALQCSVSLVLLLASACSGRHSHSKLTRPNLEPVDSRPIVGILSESVPEELHKGQYPWAQSAIFESYVSFCQMGGVRVIPLFIARDTDYYQHRFNSINGVVIAGEDSALTNSDYIKDANALLDLAKQANDNKDFFPVLTINAGSLVLANWLAKSDMKAPCSCCGKALPLSMTSKYIDSQLFHNLPADVNESLVTRNVTYNDHTTCLPAQNTSQGPLAKLVHVLSTNKDDSGMEFVSTYETPTYPFFGVQWHPERNPFEWSLQQPNIPHSMDSVRVSQFLANFFSSLARKSNHHFADPQEEKMALIPHYNLYYITNMQTPINTLYLFRNNTK